MMKISKRTREQAALLCAIAASSRWIDRSISHASGCAEAPPGAQSLAVTAWLHAYYEKADHPYAEAESLLRSNWSPP
jgi:hypothetical protein